MTTFTVIASSFRATNTMEVNYLKHEQAMQGLIQRNMCDLKTVLGVYHEEGMEAASREVSIMNMGLSWTEVKQSVSFFCDYFQQDCILVINNDNGRCTLMHHD